jgi:hypothetical protein
MLGDNVSLLSRSVKVDEDKNSEFYAMISWYRGVVIVVVAVEVVKAEVVKVEVLKVEVAKVEEIEILVV